MSYKMIKGIGIDILKIDYIDQMLQKYGNVFLQKFFSAAEIQAYQEKKRFSNHFLAGRFAAKEAFLKAFSAYGSLTLEFCEIEIINNAAGCPELRVLRKNFMQPDNIWISISHHKEYAVAQVVIESMGDSPIKEGRYVLMNFPNKINEGSIPFTAKRGGQIKVFASPKTIGTARLIMGIAVLSPGDEIKAHVHDYGEEVVFVSKGTGVLFVDDESSTLNTGDVFVVKQGQRHSILNDGGAQLEMVFASAPLAPAEDKGHRAVP